MVELAPKTAIQENAMIANVVYVKHLSRAFYMSWTLTNRCNYSCEYCITANEHVQTPLTDAQIGEGLIKLAWKINKLNPENCNVRFLGGEPTLVKDLTGKLCRFFELLKSNRISFCLQTNLSQPYEYYKHMFDLLYSSLKKMTMKFTLQTAFYPDFANMDAFLTKLKSIKSRFPLLKLSVKFIADNSNYESMNALFNKFKAKGFNTDLYPNMANIFALDSDLSSEKTDVLNQSQLSRDQLIKEQPSAEWKNGKALEVKFDDGAILYFKNFNHLLIYVGLNKLVFKGHYCSAGFNSIRIEPDGAVYRSQAPCIRVPESRLGNVLEGFDFYNEIMQCPVPIGCNCMSRLYNGIEYPEYITKDCLVKYIYPDFGLKKKIPNKILRKAEKLLHKPLRMAKIVS